MFDDLEVPEDVKSRGDKLGGSAPFTSGIYNFKIILAYADKSSGGANSLNIHLQGVGDDQRIHRETLYVTSGDSKGNKTYSINKRTGDPEMLPGCEMANDLCLLATGKYLVGRKEQPKVKFEEKTIELYDFETKTDVPVQKKVCTDLMGKTITAGLLQRLVNKRIDSGGGVYVNSAETKTETIVDKFFRMKDGLTVTEIIGKATEAKFLAKWEAQNKDKVVDATKKGVTKVPTNGADASVAAGDNPFA